MSADALQAAFPALAEALPRISFSALPTPLDAAPALGAALGIGSLAIKRDDLTSPLYGGNKVRKLEYLLAHALASGCDAVVTYGSVGSNHALATAIFATRLGLGCHAVLLDQALTPYVAATLRHHLRVGTRLHPARSFNDSGNVAAAIGAAHPRGAQGVYEIPWGGSNWRGAAGFVAAGLELAGQLGAGATPDYLYVAGGTMGTAIGLTLGLRVAGLETRIVAPRVVPYGQGAAAHVEALLVETNRELTARDPRFPVIDEPMRNLELRGGFLGAGYAAVTPEAREALTLMHDVGGVTLETTYTGKAFAALIADARAGRLADKRVVFWNTYSSAPRPADLAEVDVAALPPAFRGYLQPAAS
ncbi:MAG: pyridoxal-phosphate dependent enzyme [Gammaproteobacteria bacterium]|nr:pyridoxal-phosphate dependent enzyme [Gammaproteobacteria bacterium]